ncbi:acyltransferase [Brachybacterium hainanense]|uniref:Acyltransferase n=1 Tax=Brachybacterium hainanense TaxID=1541174 RepID=A0ABV6RDG7_9MICO
MPSDAPRTTPSEAGSTAAHSTGTARTYLPYLDLARVLAILGVVAIHVVGGGVGSGEVGTAVIALDMALVVAVPVFFMISGALTLDPRAHSRGPGAFLLRRARRIIPALVFWSAFYIIAIRGMVSGRDISLRELAEMIITGHTYTHLYFLFAIAGLYLIAPLVQPFLAPNEKVRTWVLGSAACVWAVGVMAIGQAHEAGLGSSEPVQIGTFTFFLVYLGYFVLGRALVIRPIPRWAAVLGLVSVPAFIAVITWIFITGEQMAEHGRPAVWASVLAPSPVALPVMAYAVTLMASVSSLCRTWRVSERTEKVLRTLGEASFGIYLVHFAVLVILRATVPALDAYVPGPMAVTWCLTVLISAAIALIGRRVPGLRLVL